MMTMAEMLQRFTVFVGGLILLLLAVDAILWRIRLRKEKPLRECCVHCGEPKADVGAPYLACDDPACHAFGRPVGLSHWRRV